MNRDAITIINTTNQPITQEEIDMYIEHLRSQYGREPDELTIEIVGDFVDLNSTYHTPPFQRIRRITGYLVGDLDRFNNGKRKEEADRVKHGLNVNGLLEAGKNIGEPEILHQDDCMDKEYPNEAPSAIDAEQDWRKDLPQMLDWEKDARNPDGTWKMGKHGDVDYGIGGYCPHGWPGIL